MSNFIFSYRLYGYQWDFQGFRLGFNLGFYALVYLEFGHHAVKTDTMKVKTRWSLHTNSLFTITIAVVKYPKKIIGSKIDKCPFRFIPSPLIAQKYVSYLRYDDLIWGKEHCRFGNYHNPNP